MNYYLLFVIILYTLFIFFFSSFGNIDTLRNMNIEKYFMIKYLLLFKIYFLVLLYTFYNFILNYFIDRF